MLSVLHDAAVWVSRKTIDPTLAKALPEIYDRLDYEMPYILRTSSYESIHHLVFGLVAKATGLKNETEINKFVDEVCELYDPRLGASRQ